MGRLKDLTGLKINKWTVVERSGSKNTFATWKCVCECGAISLVTTTNLTRGKSKSCLNCGHRLRAKKRRIPIKEMGFKYFIKYNEKNRRNGNDVGIDLTTDEWYNIASKECFYCGEPPKQFSPYKYKDEILYLNGLDKVDSNGPYSVENCVACCSSCNLAKNSLTKELFFEKIKKIYERHKL